MFTPGPPPLWLRPWRCAAVGWVVAAFLLLAGVPLFLCMPPWNDVTLHDLAVRAMLRGGVHYRDVFDTNLPGIDWAMAAVRLVFGWSYEALRAVDLVVIGVEVWLLAGWVRRAGAAGYTVAWLAAAVALWYPFTSEFNHAQRDPWLLLPAMAAARLRVRRVEAGGRVATSVFEGLVWGAAVWVKPHVVVPALVVWLISVMLISRQEPRRAVLLDLTGLMVGGLLAGAAGVTWLVGTGAWPYFLDVFLNWNPGYLADVLGGTGFRLGRTFWCFGPWSLLHAAAIPLAMLALWQAWSRREWSSAWLFAPVDSERVAAARALLAGLYLGWFAQAVVLQKAFDYVQVPLLLLAMGVVATHRWAFGFTYFVGYALVGVLANLGVGSIQPHPLANREVMELWPRCWREGGSPQLRDQLGHFTDTRWGTNWQDLDAVARFLRTLELGPGELNCWHDTTHPLYLMLDLDPATRYMHYATAFGIRTQADRIAADVASSRQRYVVSDRLGLPTEGSPSDLFPWNQPVIFRAGRYQVHRIANPLGTIDLWN